MYPPIFAVCAASADVQQKLGTNPTRLFLFGQAPENVAKPYAVWQTITGSPYNQLSTLPDTDRYTLQVDVYGVTVGSVRDAAEALRDAIQGVAHIVGWRGESRDKETQNYRYSFDVDWHVQRPPQT